MILNMLSGHMRNFLSLTHLMWKGQPHHRALQGIHHHRRGLKMCFTDSKNTLYKGQTHKRKHERKRKKRTWGKKLKTVGWTECWREELLRNVYAWQNLQNFTCRGTAWFNMSGSKTLSGCSYLDHILGDSESSNAPNRCLFVSKQGPCTDLEMYSKHLSPGHTYLCYKLISHLSSFFKTIQGGWQSKYNYIIWIKNSTQLEPIRKSI